MLATTIRIMRVMMIVSSTYSVHCGSKVADQTKKVERGFFGNRPSAIDVTENSIKIKKNKNKKKAN